jgi:hypothetical protein
MTLSKLSIPMPHPLFAVLSGEWTKRKPWDWNGSVTAPEPIVAMSFLAVGGDIRWARSEKNVGPQLQVRLLLGLYDATGRDVRPNFGIGLNSVYSRVMLEAPDQVSGIPASREIAVGECFPFCEPFGTPQVSLYGLLLLREQVKSARVGIWHLKPEYATSLSEPWNRVFTHARCGVLQGCKVL